MQSCPLCVLVSVCVCLWVITQRADMRFHFRIRLHSVRPFCPGDTSSGILRTHFYNVSPPRSQSARISIRCSLPHTIWPPIRISCMRPATTPTRTRLATPYWVCRPRWAWRTPRCRRAWPAWANVRRTSAIGPHTCTRMRPSSSPYHITSAWTACRPPHRWAHHPIATSKSPWQAHLEPWGMKSCRRRR